jgi:RNA polymerase sigma-70 factor (ECF subfamily)
MKYAPQLVFIINGVFKSNYVTDEIIQEIFMRVWFNREKLSAIDEPRNWILRVAANVCYTFLKRVMIENKIKNTIRQETYYNNNEVAETVQAYTLASDIHHAIKSLTPEQKIVYQLSREKGLTVPEIAEELSLSPNNIRGLLSSSLEDVQDFLHRKGHLFCLLLAPVLFL